MQVFEVRVETSETFDGEHCAEINGPNGLVDIITGRRTVSSLSCIKKYGYLTKHYSPLDRESLFNPIQDGSFRGCSRKGEPKSPPSLKSVIHILQ